LIVDDESHVFIKTFLEENGMLLFG
jgi:hypothetical protein